MVTTGYAKMLLTLNYVFANKKLNKHKGHNIWLFIKDFINWKQLCESKLTARNLLLLSLTSKSGCALLTSSTVDTFLKPHLRFVKKTKC